MKFYTMCHRGGLDEALETKKPILLIMMFLKKR